MIWFTNGESSITAADDGVTKAPIWAEGKLWRNARNAGVLVKTSPISANFTTRIRLNSRGFCTELLENLIEANAGIPDFNVQLHLSPGLLLRKLPVQL
jgi:hypothetical protein